MQLVTRKLKPAAGFGQLIHLGLQIILPALVFILVRLQFVQLALSLVVLSKWRMFAVHPRFWLANIRVNAVDITVGIATVLFMAHASNSHWLQLAYAVLYAGWLIALKPATGTFMVSLQALIGQLAGLMALYTIWPNGSLLGLTLGTGVICFVSAHHFFDNFSEPYARLLSYVWGYMGAALAWLLGHWLLYYQVIAQPTLLLTTLGYGLAVLYYLDHEERLNKGLRQQFIFIMVAIVLVVLIFSDWGDKVV